jgi:hypothetical protein
MSILHKSPKPSVASVEIAPSRQGTFGEDSLMTSPPRTLTRPPNLSKPSLQAKSLDEELPSADLQAKEFSGKPVDPRAQLARSARFGHHFERVSLTPQPIQAQSRGSDPGFVSQPLAQSGHVTGALMAFGLKQQAQWMHQSATRLDSAQLVQTKPVAVQQSTQGHPQISGGFLDWALPKELVEAKNRLGQILGGAAGVIFSILKNPVGFLGNLVTGLKKGFQNFVGNIGQYLQSGLVQWLTGALGGIQMPKDVFSIKGIFSLVTQVLGATWNQIRGRIVKAIPGGEKAMSALEQGTEIFQVAMKEGIGGLWEHVKDQFGDIKGQVMDQIKDMVVMQGIQQGIKFILSMLNPVSGLVRAAIGIYDVVKFFIERGKQVASLVEAVTGSIKAVAAGSVDQAAKMVESALGRSIPVLIGFLSSVAGLGNLASKVQGIFQKMKKPLDKAVEWLIQKAKDLVLKLGKKLGLVKDNKRNTEPEKGNQKVPKSIVTKGSVEIDQPQESLVKEIAETPSGTVIFKAKTSDPKQATKELLIRHPAAKFDPKSEILTLPPVKDTPLEAAKSLKALGLSLAQQTGLTQVILTKTSSGWSLDGKINPTVAGLAKHTGAPPSLDPLIQEIKGHETTISPSIEFFMSICREAAKRHGASINFSKKMDTSMKPHRSYTEVTFSKATASGVMETFVTEIVSTSNNTCPACDADPGVTRPHNVIPASMWKATIQGALTAYGITISLADQKIGQIVAAGTSTKGPAVTEDKQCRKCEDNQDKAPGPYSLLQRQAGKLSGRATTISHPSAKTGTSGGDLFTGLQFKNASQGQLDQFTKDKIDQVVERIKAVLATVPPGHPIHTSIIAPGNEAAFLSKIKNDAYTAATATPSAYPV